MLKEKQGHQETEVFKTEVKSSDIFNKVLDGVGEAICDWYHIGEEEIPCLDPERIKFISDEEFFALEKKDKVGDNLFNLGLRLAEIDPNLFPGKKDFEAAASYVNPRRSPLTLYFRQNPFVNLSSQDKVKRFVAAYDLGCFLLRANISLLPRPKETTEQELIKLPEERLLGFFQKLKGLPLTESQLGELGKAEEIFSLFLKEDITRKTFLYGAQIILALEEESIPNSQFSVGEEIDKAITLFLTNLPEKALLAPQLARELLGLSEKASRRLPFKRNIEREKLIGKAREFLWKLGLKDYWGAFDAYRKSEIPEIFLERLKIKPDLKYPL